MNEQEMFQRSKDKWGLASQINILAEESAELAVVALHMNRTRKQGAECWESFAEEIADVQFMIAEMKDYFPILQAKVNLYRSMKSARLQKLLEENKE